MSPPTIQWYPGHIAKAEQQLSKNLDKIDLVIEVRDARIPIATAHPQLQRWIKGKQHLLVINRRDMISSAAQQSWDRWFRDQAQTPCGAMPRLAQVLSRFSKQPYELEISSINAAAPVVCDHAL